MGGFLEMLRGLGPVRLGIIGVVTAAMIGFFVVVGMKVTAPTYSLLYGNLEMQESAQIVAKLDGLKVPYKLAAGGAEILVPDQQVLKTRMALAQSGLPSGGSIGYEIFDKGDQFGTTAFVQQINQTRALEGELARTIRSIDGVQNARVHLVLPKREVFSREMRPASASIVLKVRGRLDTPQVRAIQNLVAASVPDLKPSRISIVDERGNLLASGTGDDDAKGAEYARFNDLRRQQEQRLRQAIEGLLERSVGLGNVRAEVTADMDYDRVTVDAEEFNPEQQVVRSTQTVNEQNRTQDGAQQSVSVASNLPENQGSSGNQSQSSGSRTEETVNYEISKTKRQQVREGGSVKRLSVAVLVNGATKVEDGKKVTTPRTEEELRRFSQLVRSAIGYDEKRGDVVEVVSMQFNEIDDLPAVGDGTIFMGLTKDDLIRIGSNVMLGLLFILVLLLVVRPVLMRLLGFNREDEERGKGGMPTSLGPGVAMPGMAGLIGPDGGALAELPPGGDLQSLMAPSSNIDAMIDIARIDGQVKASSLKKIGEIVDKHPDEAVAIVRNWLYAE